MRKRDLEAQKRYKRGHYARNKERIIREVHERRGRIRDFVRGLKDGKVCQRCGFDNLLALDFHHRDPKQKDLSIAKAIELGWSKERILAEVAKCDLICANCHRIEHGQAPLM